MAEDQDPQQPTAIPEQPPQSGASEGENVSIDDEENDVEDTEDGGAIVRFEQEQKQQRVNAHFANIVEDVDQAKLKTLVNDLLDKIERDKEAREKRDKLYEEGLRRTGLGDDAPGGAQFTGANKVVHPMLVEACVDFSARFMKETFPPNGPVRSKIEGDRSKDKLDKAERKTDFMNWQTTEQMPEFRGELEQLSTQLPLGGVQYLTLTFNRKTRRPVSEFVPVDDIYLPFAATNFYTAERRTRVLYITSSMYREKVESGEYRDVDLPDPENPEFSKSSVANDKIEGRKETSYNEDGLRTVFEITTSCDIEGDWAPYILTVDKSTDTALSLYRNWEPDDELKQELDWTVEFPFIPWRGAYPIGLTHMIGGLSGAVTGALRALLDSAHIQNVPTMLKLKGGPGGQTLNIQPTEVVEIEGGALIDDVRKLAMALPFNPPSPVLFQLLGFLVDAGRNVVQTSFEKLSDQNPNQPVGTTLALIEQGMVVFSSIHARLHSAMGRVFKILHRINSAYLTEEDIERLVDLDISPADFDGPMDVIPVSDPNIFSETQRFAQVQAVMQRAAVMPAMYDQRKIEEMFLRSMKLDDDLLKPKPGEQDLDPVSENVAAAMGQPVYVLPKQDHMMHMKVHMAFLTSPLFGQNPAILKTYILPMARHLRDHLLNYYLFESHTAAREAVKSQMIPSEAQQEAQVIARVQQYIEQELAGFGQLLAQIDQQAQQFMPKPQMPPDNTMQVAQLNANVQQQAIQQRAQSDAARNALQQQKMQFDAQQKQQSSQSDLQREIMRLQSELQRAQAEMASRERINTQDNQTAMTIAMNEISAGHRSALSTGTGINPNQ